MHSISEIGDDDILDELKMQVMHNSKIAADRLPTPFIYQSYNKHHTKHFIIYYLKCY